MLDATAGRPYKLPAVAWRPTVPDSPETTLDSPRSFPRPNIVWIRGHRTNRPATRLARLREKLTARFTIIVVFPSPDWHSLH
jgi:hypothetical protein